jgi:hypothetical protein
MGFQAARSNLKARFPLNTEYPILRGKLNCTALDTQSPNYSEPYKKECSLSLLCVWWGTKNSSNIYINRWDYFAQFLKIIDNSIGS